MDWLICAETSVSMKCLPSPTLLMLSFIWEWSEIILFIYEIYTKLHFYKRSKSNWLSLSLCLHSHIINIVTTFYLITLCFFRIYSSIYQFKNESTVRLCVYENLWYFFLFAIINFPNNKRQVVFSCALIQNIYMDFYDYYYYLYNEWLQTLLFNHILT